MTFAKICKTLPNSRIYCLNRSHESTCAHEVRTVIPPSHNAGAHQDPAHPRYYAGIFIFLLTSESVAGVKRSTYRDEIHAWWTTGAAHLALTSNV
jgi:hypothetical protein